MDVNKTLNQLVSQFKETGLLEWGAFILGVAQVVLARFNKTINFYFGIASVLLYTHIFFNYGLYAESALNGYYLLISVLGLFFWYKKMPSITKCGGQDTLYTVLIVCCSFALLYSVLKFYTDSQVPVYDAAVSSLAWGGSWLLVKRKLENWLVLNLSNILAIPLLLYKGLALTAVLTGIYFVVAVSGYLSWRKEIQHAT